MVSVAEAAAALAHPPAPPRHSTAIKRFRASLLWRRARYAALARSDGRCECCGRRAGADVVLHVDHIEPLSRNWDRRLDPTNLQVLCADCNVGKLDGPARDWRPGAERDHRATGAQSPQLRERPA